jgi:ribonuclease HI
MQKVVIFTDGACKGNPGRGGIGYHLICEAGKTLKGSKCYFRTTSSRMELMAAIEALRLLKFPCKVELYTDSRYLAYSVNKGWLNTWLFSPFFLNRKSEDLWCKLALELQKHQVGIHWIKGHSKYIKNCLADRLASGACSSGSQSNRDPGVGDIDLITDFH